MEATIESRVKEAVSLVTGVEVKDMTSETKIRADLGLDSLDEIELVMALEDEFKIEIPDEAMTDEDWTVAKVVEYITTKTGH